jgi:hypothetical protein
MTINHIDGYDHRDGTAGYYSVSRLTVAEALIALPLCQSFYPQVDREGWCRYVAAQENSEAGVLIARDPFGIIHGLLCFRTTVDLLVGKVMDVDKIAVAGPVDRSVALLSLLDTAELFASHFNCVRVNAIIPEWRSAGVSYRLWLAEALRDAGMQVTAAVLTREVTPEPSPGPVDETGSDVAALPPVH